MLKYQGVVLLAFSICAAPHTFSEELTEAKPSPYPQPNILAKPGRCVALRQGQKCYQKITFSWKTPSEGEYCLHRASIDTPLICWRGNDLLKYRYTFSGSESEPFFIFNKTSNTRLTSTLVQVAWVYKSKKRAPTGWRLF